MESEFQAAKIELLFGWLEVYEHVCDLVEQNRLIQLMTDLMARRPRFNLDAAYFRSAYQAEVKCLQKETEVLKSVMRYQMENERKEMHDLKEFLQTKYQKVKEHMDQHWRYYRGTETVDTPKTKSRKSNATHIDDRNIEEDFAQGRSPSPYTVLHDDKASVAVSSKVIEEGSHDETE